jgi:hypothetical protein
MLTFFSFLVKIPENVVFPAKVKRGIFCSVNRKVVLSTTIKELKAFICYYYNFI